MLRMRYVHEIVVNLSVLRYVIEFNAKQKMYDVPKACERLFMRIFNLVFKWNLKDLNQSGVNYPAIDLGDINRSLGIQVTCERDRSKIERTLLAYENNHIDQFYKKLYVFILTQKRDYEKDFIYPVSQKKFSKKRIYDISDFMNILESLQDDVLEKLYLLIKKEIGYCFDSKYANYKSISASFPEFGSRKHQTLNKLGITFPDQDVDEIYEKIDALPLNYRLAVYTFIKKSYKNELKMNGIVFSNFMQSIGLSDVDALFNGPLALLDTDGAEPKRYEVISIRYEDMWNLILDKVDEVWWEQLIVYADFSLLD